jgi:lipoprotein NlpD
MQTLPSASRAFAFGATNKLLLASALLVALLAGCTTSVPAPVVDRTTRPVVTPRPDIRPLPTVATGANPSVPGNTAGSQFHVVQRGETLYGIARNNGVDVNSLAAWNNMTTTQPIREGQVLRLQPVTGAATGLPPGATVTPMSPNAAIQGQPLPGPTSPPPVLVPVGPTPIPSPSATPGVTPVEAPLKREPKSQRVAYSDAALAAMQRSEGVSPTMPMPVAPVGDGRSAVPAVAPASPAASAAVIEAEIRPGNGVDREGIAWTWPTTGKVASKFNDKAPMKGIDIAANAGTALVAAATGKVIYVGKEPRGYGQMIVVSHAKETVSVYFHADKVQVKEQQRVLLGQKLAEVSDAAGNKMHFEVRRQGRPLDPLGLMPR